MGSAVEEEAEVGGGTEELEEGLEVATSTVLPSYDCNPSSNV